MQKLLGKLRRAVSDYGMIKSGEKIAVGLSGGKDSLLLLTLLAKYRVFSPEQFELTAITIDTGMPDTDFSALTEYCKSLNVPHIIEKSDIYEVVFNIRKESNPCALCSKMRRGALNNVAKENGCYKLALGHNLDDLLETFMMSMFYEGRLSTFMPVSFMDRSGVTLIRPLLYIEERDVISAAKRYGFPVLDNKCPVNKHTEREHIKSIVKSIVKEIPISKDRMISALLSPERYNLLDKCPRLTNKLDLEGNE